MKNDIFVDTSGFYSLLVKRDLQHNAAKKILHSAAKTRKRFVTTDYVLDETATLLKARGHGFLLAPFFDIIFTSKTCRVEWTDSDRFFSAKDLFLKHEEKGWSFTDCLSFCVMKELKICDALTKDGHFKQAELKPLLI